MSGLLGPGSTLGDLDLVLVELVEAGELRAGISADGRLRFEPVHARAGSGVAVAGPSGDLDASG